MAKTLNRTSPYVIKDKLHLGTDGQVLVERVDDELVLADTVAGTRQLQDFAVTTKEAITLVVDPIGGSTPPAGTKVRSQAEYDALGYDLLLVQDALNILPTYISHIITVTLRSGTHLAAGEIDGCPTLTFASVPYYENVSMAGFIADYPYWPSIVFEGEGETVLDAEQAGTVNDATSLTRSAGTWTSNEHKGKLCRIDTGANAGSIAPVRSNTTDTLLLAHNLTSTGACTFTIYEPDTYLVPSTDGVALDCTVMLKKPYTSSPGPVPLFFLNCGWGTSAFPAKQSSVVGISLNFENCVAVCNSSPGMVTTSGGGLSSCFTRYQFISCAVELLGGRFMSTLGWLTNYYIRNLFVFGPTNYPCISLAGYAWCRLTQTFIEAQSARAIIEARGIGELILWGSIDGGGVAPGIVLTTEGTQLTRAHSTITVSGNIDNCTAALQIEDGGDAQIEIYDTLAGTGNTKGIVISGSAKARVPDLSVLGGVTEIEVDGVGHTYSEIGTIGDAIEGAEQSLIVRMA